MGIRNFKIKRKKDNINLSKEKEDLIELISRDKEDLKEEIKAVCRKYAVFEVHMGIIPKEERKRICSNDFSEVEQNALYEEIFNYCTINLDEPSVHM